jgi:hypothetical protein
MNLIVFLASAKVSGHVTGQVLMGREGWAEYAYRSQVGHIIDLTRVQRVFRCQKLNIMRQILVLRSPN